MKYVASVSFGKDSLAMLLLLMDKKCSLDEVVFYDTGMEFQSIYKIRDKILHVLKEKNIKYVELKPSNPFEYTMFGKQVRHRDGTTSKGYSWCGGRCRWGTTEKNRTITKYLKNNYGNDYIEYIGIASDETRRISYEKKHKSYPLVKYNMTEKDCLQYCHDKGFEWIENGIELYSILDRVSCWCCANKNIKELKNYYKHLPAYWDKLKDFQKRTDRPFKNNKVTVFDLEEKFKKENIDD